MFYDLQADPDPNLNDINNVVADPQLDRDLLSLQEAARLVAEGKTVVESTGPVTIASVEPVKVDLEGGPAHGHPGGVPRQDDDPSDVRGQAR